MVSVIDFLELFMFCSITLQYLLNDDMQDQQEFNIPEEVNEETSRTVQEFVKYFASQRSIMNKVILYIFY